MIRTMLASLDSAEMLPSVIVVYEAINGESFADEVKAWYLNISLEIPVES